jgi:hypothetical protein
MEDHRLGELLRELPREHARPGFTARVLQRLEAPARTAPHGWRLALAAALTAAVLSAGALIGRRPGPPDSLETAQARQILHDLRIEHERLEREWREMAQPPVVYIGGNESMDLVLDLGKVGAAEGATPAAYHGETF